MNDIKDFKEYELYPALWDRVPQAFPELDFKFKGGYWRSNKHIDGRASSKPDRTFIHYKRKDLIKDNSGDAMSLIDYVMMRDRSDFITALNTLASVCGLTVPNSDSEEYQAYRQEQKQRETALHKFSRAMWSDEALPVREYLHGRGWSDEEIKQADLGYISEAERNSLNSPEFLNPAIGTTHRLVIPFRTGSVIRGFKFRLTNGESENKYINSKGLSKSSALFNISIGCTDATVVEGELDALHASVKGAKNVVATTGGAVGEGQITDAIRRGIKRFTLLLDNDARGRDFIASSVKNIESKGASCYIATLPEGKDTDEYLRTHSLDEWQRAVDEAVPACLWKINNLIAVYADKGEALTFKDREDFFIGVKAVINNPATRVEDRQVIYNHLQGELSPELFDIAEYRDYIDKEYLRKQARQRSEAVRTASTDIAKLIEDNKIDEALSVMRLTSQEQTAKEKETGFAQVFAPQLPEDIAKFLSEVQEGIPTGFAFSNDKHYTELTLNPGLTFICGYRGHCKTTFLNNIALNNARQNLIEGNGKSVLYFSYEVDKRRLLADLLNTYVNDKDISHNPYETILGYFKGCGAKYFATGNKDGLSHFARFELLKDKFFKEYISTGAITIVDENYKVGELLEAIKYYVKSREVSIICIDYAQLLYSEDYNRARTEEIKQVVNQIKDFANKQGIPFVLAAQFNREVESPVSIDTKNIGEGGDFERIADTVIGLFNLKELHPLPKNDKEEKEAKRLLTALGVAEYGTGDTLKPIDGKIFCRLLKRRYGYYPLDAVLTWEGKTKYIEPNDKDSLNDEALPF